MAAKDPLFSNKVAAAALVALLLIFGVPQLVGALVGGPKHGGGHGEEGKVHLAYPIEYEDQGGGGAAEAGPKKDLGTLLAEAKPEAGARRVALCKSCHSLEKGGPNMQGPDIYGVVGRTVASHEGFNYSAALKAFGGEWTWERLDKFIQDSPGYIPGTAMNQHIAKAEHRAEILVYLNTLSDKPLPLPTPAPAAAPAEAAAAPAAGTAPAAAPAAEPAQQPSR